MATQSVRIGWRPYVNLTSAQAASNLLDSYSGAAAAYSLRKIKSSYTGSAIRVRRSSDNAELNIGFDSDGNLDTYALSAFVGSVSGFVTTWYDQSGNSKDVIQTTAIRQPHIVDTGVLLTSNGKPGIKFMSDASGSYFLTGTVNRTNTNEAMSMYAVYRLLTITRQAQFGWGVTELEPGANSSGIALHQNSVFAYSPNNAAYWSTNLALGSVVFTGGLVTNNTIYYNGVARTSNITNGGNTNMQIGGTLNIGKGAYSGAKSIISELIFYPNGSQNSNVSLINNDINSYYSIYPNPSSVWNLLTAAYNADTTALPSLKTSLFAVYNGESNTNDSKGTNNGTAVGGLTYTAGKIGDAFQFNGSNALVSLPNTSGQFNFDGDFTISVWFRSSSLSSSRYFMTNLQNNGSTYGYGWSFFYSASLGWVFDLNNGASTNRVNFQSGYSANTWYHVVAVRKMGQKHKIYVNAVDTPAGQFGNVNTTAGYIANQKMDLGGISSLSLSALCDLDGVNMWNKALTQAEVSELYNSGNGAQYITDSFYKPTTNDALNTNNGTAQGGLTYGVGKVGTAFQFNGSNAYVALPNNIMKFSNTDNFSVSFWIYATVTGFSSVIGNNSFIGGQGTGWGIRTWGTVGGDPSKFTIVFWTNWVNGSGNLLNPLSTLGTTSINTWNHFVITRNSSAQEKIYQNGTLVASQTNSSTKLIYPATSYSNIGVNRYDSTGLSTY